MSRTIFGKQIEPDCGYCRYGYIMNDENHCICEKYGIIERRCVCMTFKYQPLKRKPKRPARLSPDQIPDSDEMVLESETNEK